MVRQFGIADLLRGRFDRLEENFSLEETAAGATGSLSAPWRRRFPAACQ